ncbi:hypothetical protein [Planktomarina temperata]|uniref:hypothetical protein n=1 Tax=Planktomarina temperata TaxID=1284658 RepID=UPI001E016EB5|nr:hypothetical protein [Planktomarina temperata]
MKLSVLPAILLTTTASIAQAGGFEAQTLDTGFMYEEGAVLTASTASLNSNLTEANGAKILKDQNFTSFSIKSKVGPLDVGLTTYRSGAIQMSGAASPTLSPNPIPNADANIETLTALLKYDLSENFSVLAGINSDKLGTSVISTPAGRYDISSSSGTGYLAGVTYSRPAIALRVELRLQSESDLSTTTDYTGATSVLPGIATSLKRPQTMTLSFQSGIAADTLLFGSVHRAKWSATPITVGTTTTLGSAAINNSFSDSTKYSIGLGRKFSDKISASLSYTREAGAGATDSSLFTISGGNQSYNLGVKYTLSETTSISAGYSRTEFDDVTITGYGPASPVYTGNSANTFGVKLQVNF